MMCYSSSVGIVVLSLLVLCLSINRNQNINHQDEILTQNQLIYINPKAVINLQGDNSFPNTGDTLQYKQNTIKSSITSSENVASELSPVIKRDQTSQSLSSSHRSNDGSGNDIFDKDNSESYKKQSMEATLSKNIKNNSPDQSKNESIDVSATETISSTFSSMLNFLWHLFQGKQYEGAQNQQSDPPRTIHNQFSDNGSGEGKDEIAQRSQANGKILSNKQQKQQQVPPDSAKQISNTANLQVKEPGGHQQETGSMPANVFKKQKKQYFIIGTLLFGVISMILIKIIKRKEEESEDFHRSGVLVPLQEAQGDHL